MKPNQLPDSFLKARRALLLDHPFFGSLVMALEPVIDPSCQSIWVDGKKLGFAETFFDSIPILEGAGVLAHEIMHCALEHQLRRGDRDPKLWNDSCDYVINPMVKKSGLPLPANTLFNPAYEGKSAEEVYATLNTQKPKGEEGEGNSQGKGASQPPQNRAQGREIAQPTVLGDKTTLKRAQERPNPPLHKAPTVLGRARAVQAPRKARTGPLQGRFGTLPERMSRR
ncbi:MAG: hypothetical protein Q8P12_01610 [bacterium]|nr:hypothetical protein [bacterium]